ncbi:prolipoprotein diacylglyceryl transferase [Mesoplasma photuris]|uniref:prolipoprotein diacylglyceryl transferase n=1 Tax=Mesoplasma photuris TaxID=217731 RepID=UPI000A7FBA8E|nr:prolipoprotein diacylglyceryl transferase family protein [Mesoplasma photuris]
MSLFSSDNTLFDWMQENGSFGSDRLIGGVIPAYPIFMFLGILAVIVASIVKMKMRGIPLREFELAILIVVPIGILGGTIFGKIFLPLYSQPDMWYKIFFFWDPGMSLFGALFLGTIGGFGFFYKRSKTTMISVWVYADCIVPNILLGQAIGRWGNFYNHEILGTEVSWEQLAWLPDYIREKLFYFPDLIGFVNSEGVSIVQQQINWADPENWAWVQNDFWNSDGVTLGEYLKTTPIVYRQPLFLYESMANIALWIIINFGVLNIGRLFSKPKPWDLEPTAFPGWYNKHAKHLPQSKVKEFNIQLPVKYKKVVVKNESGNDIEVKLSLYRAWNKAYYWYEPDQQENKEAFEIINNNIANMKEYNLRSKTLKDQNTRKIALLKREYKHKMKLLSNKNPKKQIVKTNFKVDLAFTKKDYKNKQKELMLKYTPFKNTFDKIMNVNASSGILEKLHNPNNYLVIRSGVATGSYVFGYLIIRIVLETFRKPTEYFIPNATVANFLVLAIILLSGIAIIVISQFVAPKKWREAGWLYEKSY